MDPLEAILGGSIKAIPDIISISMRIKLLEGGSLEKSEMSEEEKKEIRQWCARIQRSYQLRHL